MASASRRHNKDNTGVVSVKAKTVTLATKHAGGIRHRGMVSVCNRSGEVGVTLCDFRQHEQSAREVEAGVGGK